MKIKNLLSTLSAASLLALVTMTSTAANAEEVWSSPSASGGPFTDVGDWAVTRGGATYFTVAIPDDFDEFLGASVLAIGSGLGGGGTQTFDIEIGVSVASSGDSSSAATYVTQQTITVSEGVLSDIDLSAALDLAYLAGADYVAVSITPPNGSSKHLNLVGMRFQFGSTDGDTDPTNELNTAFTYAGTTISITDAGGTLSADLSSLEESADIAANAADIATNAADIATNSADIASNDADIANNTAGIATNSADIATNSADIANNTSDIANNASDISDNAAGIATNSADIATNATDIANNTSDIANNASDISDNAAGIATNSADIANNTSDIANNASDISDNAADIATNTSDIATNTSDIANNTSDIANNASDISDNAAGIATNSADIASNDADIAANASDIATNSADIASNDADIAANTSGIATNAAAIASNDTDIAANATGVATNAAAIASNDADIAANASGISANAGLINGHIAADGDLSSTNELQSWSTLPGIPAGFVDGVDNVNDADSNPSNELQSLSLSGTTLAISSGNSVNLSGIGGSDNLGNHVATTDLNMNGRVIYNAWDVYTNYVSASVQVLSGYIHSTGYAYGVHTNLYWGAVTSWDDDGSRDCPSNRVARGFDADEWGGLIDRIRFNCAYVR